MRNAIRPATRGATGKFSPKLSKTYLVVQVTIILPPSKVSAGCGLECDEAAKLICNNFLFSRIIIVSQILSHNTKKIFIMFTVASVECLSSEHANQSCKMIITTV